MDNEINMGITGNLCMEGIELSIIRDNPLRLGYYSKSHIEGLAASILQDGLVEPVILHRSSTDGNLTILNGHYRVRALRRLKWNKVAARIVIADDISATKYFCTTLFVKPGITALDEGYVIMGLLSQGYNLEDAGALCGKSLSWASRRVNLIKQLDSNIKDELLTGTILPRIAQEIARLPRGKEQERVFRIIDKNKLTRDEAAMLVDEWIKSDGKRRYGIEEEFMKDSMDDKILAALPESTVRKAIRQCRKSVLNLLNYTCQLKTLYEIWPWKDYRELAASMKKLFEALPDEKGR